MGIEMIAASLQVVLNRNFLKVMGPMLCPGLALAQYLLEYNRNSIAFFWMATC